jgi:hypothetical protein
MAVADVLRERPDFLGCDLPFDVRGIDQQKIVPAG